MKLITLHKRVLCVVQSLWARNRQWFIITMLITQIVHHSYAQHTYFEENARTLLVCHINRVCRSIYSYIYIIIHLLLWWCCRSGFSHCTHSIACKLHTSQCPAVHSSIINAAVDDNEHACEHLLSKAKGGGREDFIEYLCYSHMFIHTHIVGYHIYTHPDGIYIIKLLFVIHVYECI